MSCPFCNPDSSQVLREFECCIALWDKHPVTEGHVLLVPRRHVHDIFELEHGERAALMAAIGEVKDLLAERYGPDGFNIGFNVGEAAGQSIDHAHVHIIPRRKGDTPRPRGGIRGAIPEKMGY